jgi:hypothetical protein
VFVEDGIYQVYNRFARGADLFSDPEEAIEFLEILRKARGRGVRGHGADGAPGICPSAEGRAAGGVAKRCRVDPGGCPPGPTRHLYSVEPVAPAAWVDELGRSTGLERPRMSPADFLSRSSALLGTTAGAIAGPGKDREISRERYIITALGIERWGIPAKALAQLVGRMPEAVSRWGSRGAEMRQESEEFREAYEKLDETLATNHLEKKRHPNKDR